MNEEYLLNHGTDKPIQIEISNVLGAELDGLSIEMDEMWSFCHDKSQQVWLWWAIDHETNTPLAYVFGTREHKYLDELLKLLEPYSIKTVYADNNYAYKDKISENRLITGKKDTQQIERDHLTLRTRIKRLARKTICFSKNKEIHMAVIGTFINTYFFGRKLDCSTILRQYPNLDLTPLLPGNAGLARRIFCVSCCADWLTHCGLELMLTMIFSKKIR